MGSSDTPPPAERPGGTVSSSWQVAVCIAWDPAICKEGNWPQAAGKKRNFPGISKGFPTLGKNGNGVCVPRDCCNPWHYPNPRDPSPSVAALDQGGDPAGSRDAFGTILPYFAKTLVELEVLLVALFQLCWSCCLGSFCIGFRLSLAAVILRNRKETTDASFRGCGMLSPASGCQQERAPLAASGPYDENGPGFYSCRWAELLVGSFPAKLSKEQAVLVRKRRREALLKAPKPPSRREENGREICKARGNEACKEE